MTLPDEAAANMRSIMVAPQAVLPDGPARRYVFLAALGGRDVYVYQAAGSGVWNLWLEGQRLCLEPLPGETESAFARFWCEREATRAGLRLSGEGQVPA